VFCIRHSNPLVFTKSLSCTTKPLINCGNGTDEHPTQALLDLMTVHNLLGGVDGVHIAIVGDLRFMRAAHSLLLALAKFKNIQVRCISPRSLRMPGTYTSFFKKNAVRGKYKETTKMDLKDVDIVYMAGFAPKTPIRYFSKKARLYYQFNKMRLRDIGAESIVLCPLPRIDEVTVEIDSTPHAKYFEQSHSGLYMRMAVLEWITTQ
jgi:aspartate carbamoyltransferase catalytic subunit